MLKLKPNKALDETTPLSYGALPAIWDHKWICPALTPASKLVLDLFTPDGWKAELA